MKKEFNNPTVRFISVQQISTAGENQTISVSGGTTLEGYNAPARVTYPTTVNGVLGSVADQK